jgi:aconitate hydratase
MSPEFGSTCGIFPIDEETIRYLELTGRSAEQRRWSRRYARAQGMWRTNGMREADYSDVVELDLTTVEQPGRPEAPTGSSPLLHVASGYRVHSRKWSRNASRRTRRRPARRRSRLPASLRAGRRRGDDRCDHELHEYLESGGADRRGPARAQGTRARTVSKPWVKTSLAPGSRVVTDYLTKAGLLPDLESVGFYIVGYGCTTCIGNSGPLKPEISDGIRAGDVVTVSVLSGNRNFEGACIRK